MLYTEKTKAALKLCFEAHRDQLDKGGLPYVFHPFHLAEQMDDEDSACAALLHDVMEDTDYTAGDLAAIGMTDAVMEALQLLTHDPSVEYMDYVARIAENPIARKVKIADLKHNSDTGRLDAAPTEADLARLRKYARALALLEQ